LSFWARSNFAGTYSGALLNGANNRSYPFQFPLTQNWTKIVITIPGDTGGTWTMSGPGVGVYLDFDLGGGTTYRGPANAWVSASYYGATGSASIVNAMNTYFLITGVKLEIGSVATPFNRQSLAKSMADCQRYFWAIPGGASLYYLGLTTNNPSWSAQPTVTFPVAMRSSPSMLNAAFTLSSGNAGTPAYSSVTPQYAAINNIANNWAQGPFSATVGLSAQFTAEL
jgi:hypothetical protein